MTMQQRRFERMIPAYLEGALTDSKRRWFERRLNRDAVCARELRAYRLMNELVTRADAEQPPEAAWDQFLPMLHRRIEQDDGEQPRSEDGLKSRWGLDALVGGLGGAFCGAVAAFAVVFAAVTFDLLPTSADDPPEYRAASETTATGDAAKVATVADESGDDATGDIWIIESHRAPLALCADTSTFLIAQTSP